MSLDPGQWARIDALFPELLSLPPADRPAALDRHCADDPWLRQELISLLDAADAADFLDAPAAVVSTEPARVETLPPGTRLGPWQLGERIGSGGMGDVYAGERADGTFQRRIAIKVIRRGLDTESVLGRFLRERRILGQLRHPNVAELIDAGATPDGRPYLVMERVDGVPITTWCVEREASLREILELMRQVCEAVHEAHRKLVVHRDLKPSNVLVTGDGQIKLLDFGVAKMLSDEIDEDTTRTLAAAPLTPAFAAPEQFLGQAVTTATDVYALGGLLYVLLCGRAPHRRDNLIAVLAGIQHSSAPRPSFAALQSDSLLRPAQRAQRSRELSGDLDWVIGKALHPEADRRYRAASELGQDLENVLRLRPVSARPDSLAYRVRRFLRRNRFAVAAATLALAGIVLALIVALVQAERARTSAALARIEAGKANAVKEFLVSIFNKSSLDDPAGVQARAVTAEELLAAGAARIRGEMREAPQIRAELLGTIGRLYARLELSAQAIPLWEEQLATLRGLDPRPRMETAQVEAQLGLMLADAGRFEDSERRLQVASAELDRIGDTDSLARIDTLIGLGEVAVMRRRAEDPEAGRLLAEALRLLESGYPMDPRRPAVLASLALAADHRGDASAAERHYRAQLALTAQSPFAERNRGERAEAHRQYGAFLRAQGRPAEAEPLLRAAESQYLAIAGIDSPWTALAESDLGELLIDLGRWEEAQRLLETALRKLKAARGEEESHASLNARRSLAALAYERGDLDAAAAGWQAVIDLPGLEPEIERALALRERARTLIGLGHLDQAANDLGWAERVILEARGDTHPTWGAFLAVRAQLRLARGEAAAALADSDAALGLMTGTGAVIDEHRHRARRLRVAALLRLGRPAEALAEAQAMQVASASGDTRAASPNREAGSLQALGTALAATGQTEAAAVVLQRALVLRESLDVATSPWLTGIRAALAGQEPGAP